MDPYLGEIRLCAFSFPPKGWAFCNGALMGIAQNQALFSLLGTQYGGDGRTTFALPDLRGRTPVHRDGVNNVQGALGGMETVTLAATQMPLHTHSFNASSSPATSINVGTTENHLLAASNLHSPSNPSVSGPGKNLYADANNLTALSNEACGTTGNGQPHENMQPSLVMNYIISLVGIYPSRN
jgi:microcystin-dependent protein